MNISAEFISDNTSLFVMHSKYKINKNLHKILLTNRGSQ